MLSAVAAHLALAAYAFFVIVEHDYSPQEFLVKLAIKAGADPNTALGFLYSAPELEEVPRFLVRPQRPRTLLPELAEIPADQRAVFWKARVARFDSRDWRAKGPCGGGMMQSAACWMTTRDVSSAKRAIRGLLDAWVEQPDANRVYGTGWKLALAYDWVADFPGMTTVQRQVIEAKLEEALQYYLLVLNADSASLWHGRMTLASNAWLVAMALGNEGDKRQRMFLNATQHFLSVVDALQLTEAWPGGFNYWVNNRAFYFGLAAAAFVNGLEDNKHKEFVRDVTKRTALWHVYATRPDHRAEGLGDEGPRVDLGEEAGRFIDLAAAITRSPVLEAYSDFLHELHGKRTYYRGYRWWYQLLMPDEIAPQAKGLARFETLLPTSELFGRGAMNLAYIRSGWNENATFISFRAGASFSHHGHYDAGHFSVFKSAPLALTSGTYGGFFSPHRLNYSIRSVAKNTLLVMRPGERVQPNRHFPENVADGGQRLVMPTGSAIQSVEDWREGLSEGKHLRGGRVLAFESEHADYTFLASDLTDAYNTSRHDEGGEGGKVDRVLRSLLYLQDQDRLLIYDRVQTVDPAYTPKWLLHTANKPHMRGQHLLAGKTNNGILESFERVAEVKNADARMRVDILLPERPRNLLIGGEDYRYYVDVDGDAATLDGRNFVQGEKPAKWFDRGSWRLEVQPEEPALDNRFLHVLSMSVGSADTGEPPVMLDSVGSGFGHALVGDQLVVFTEPDTAKELTIGTVPGLRRILLLGLPPWREVSVQQGGLPADGLRASEAGVLAVPLNVDAELRLSWR